MTHMISGSTFSRNDERIATLVVSVCAHVPNTPKVHACRLVYAEAVLSGAGKFDREAWENALGNLGTTIRVSLDDGDIDFSLQSLDTSLAKSLAMLATLFAEPHFLKKEIERVRILLINRLLLAKEDARTVAYRSFSQNLFDASDRRNMHDLDGIIAEVKKVTVKDVQTLHGSLFNHSWVYTCGGNKDTAVQMEGTIRRIRGKGHATKSVKYAPQASLKVSGRTVSLAEIPNKQNIEFSIGGALPITRNDPAYPAFVIGMAVLCLPGGFVGRLMSIVREKEGLTYSIYGRPEKVTVSEEGIWRIGTFFAPKDAVQGITSTLRELRKIHEEGITEDELGRFKTILNTQHVLMEDSLIQKVGEAQRFKKAGWNEKEYEDFKRTVQSLTREEVNQSLRAYLGPDNLIISGAGPVSSVRKELEAFEG